RVMPKGTKPSVSQSATGMQPGQPGTATGQRTTTISAEILSIDSQNNKLTFKGPQGSTSTVAVTDPDLQKRLPMPKRGQVVQLTYSEAVAASIRKADGSQMREQAPMKQGQPQQQQPGQPQQ